MEIKKVKELTFSEMEKLIAGFSAKCNCGCSCCCNKGENFSTTTNSKDKSTKDNAYESAKCGCSKCCDTTDVSKSQINVLKNQTSTGSGPF